MNEQIQDLVGRAKFMAEETTNKKISKNAELDAFAEKFAELIVRECSNFLKDTLDDHFAAEQLEEHFGVEE